MAPGGRPAEPPLVCPSCGRSHPAEQRFCEQCRLPLVHDRLRVEEPPLTDARERARKIKPQLAEGGLVRVLTAGNQAEAELIRAMLLEEGVPSMERRSAGFDVPYALSAGPRDILVPQSGLATAREVLLQAEIGEQAAAEGPVRIVVPGRLALAMLGALLTALLIVWLLFDVLK